MAEKYRPNNHITYIILSVVILFTPGCSISNENSFSELKTVSFVNPQRYMGKWYEIASFPQSFQKDCVATTATYSLRKDGDIDVLNECRLKSFDGQLKSANGKAVIVDSKTNSKLKVSFFWPFYGKYWIIDLGENYEYAVVGHPNRNYLWILSRTKKLDSDKYQKIIDRIKSMEFNISLLNRTAQPE